MVSILYTFLVRSPDANNFDLHMVFALQRSTAVCRCPRDNTHSDLLRLLLSRNMVYIPCFPWVGAAPGIFHLYTVLGFNLLGKRYSIPREYSTACRMIWTKGEKVRIGLQEHTFNGNIADVEHRRRT